MSFIEIPIYANVKLYLPSQYAIKPYLDISLGAMIATEHESKSYFTGGIGAGFTFRHFNISCSYMRYEKNVPRGLHNGVVLKAGVVF